MGFWIFMLIMALVIPVSMIGCGLMMFKRAPQNVNVVSGYRTGRSMKSRDTWMFANRYCGRMWFWCGVGMLPISAVLMLLFMGREIDPIGWAGGAICLLQCIVMFGTILLTERALKKHFDQYGRRKRPIR